MAEFSKDTPKISQEKIFILIKEKGELLQKNKALGYMLKESRESMDELLKFLMRIKSDSNWPDWAFDPRDNEIQDGEIQDGEIEKIIQKTLNRVKYTDEKILWPNGEIIEWHEHLIIDRLRALTIENRDLRDCLAKIAEKLEVILPNEAPSGISEWHEHLIFELNKYNPKTLKDKETK